jgi:TP901 family phage tail tape measure protein
MGKAEKATRSVGDGADQSSKKADSAFRRMAQTAKQNSADVNRLGNTALVAGGAIATGLGIGVKAFADFDQAMSAASAALPDAGAEMDKVRDLAVQLGRDTQFTATEAAQGVTELAKAGVDVSSILGGALPGALDLAASGQLEVADAAEIAASAMVQFKLKGSDVPHIADLLAAGAGKAQGSVYDLGQALAQAGLVAKGTGLSIEETTGGLAAFASAGLVGSDAGTSFKTMLQRLTPQSEEARAEMERLGISAYDNQGNFIGLANFAGVLQNALKDLTPEARRSAEAVIFGSDAVRAADVLYDQGATGIAKWTGAVNDAGFASRQAAALTDNLKGDIDKLGSSIDAVFIQNGAAANDALRTLTQNVKGMVDGFGALPAPVQQGVFAIAGLTGAAALTVGVFAKVVTTGGDFLESMDRIRAISPKAARGIGLVAKSTKALGVAAAALAAAGVLDKIFGADAQAIGTEGLIRDLTDAKDAVDAFSARVQQYADQSANWWSSNNVRSYSDVIHDVFTPDFAQNVDNAAGSLLSFFGAANNSDIANAKGALDSLDRSLAELANGGNTDEAARLFQQFADAAAAQGITVDELRAKLPQYAEVLARVENESTGVTGASEDVSSGLGGVEKAAKDAKDAVGDLADEIRGFGDVNLKADEAQDKFRQSVDDFYQTLQDNKNKAKDDAEAVKNGEMTKAEAARNSRDAAREQSGALRELAQNGKDVAAAILEQTGSEDKAKASMKTARDEFIKAAGQLGITGQAAQDLADKYGLIPADVTTAVAVTGAEAARLAVQNLIDTIAKMNSKTVEVGVRYTYSGVLPNGGRNQRGGQDAGTGGVDFNNADGGMYGRRDGMMVRAFADGGTIGRAKPQIRRAGGKGILWAEEGAGPWEAFISGHPGKRARSRVIAEDTVRRLGGQIQWARPFADGGMFGATTNTHTTNSPINIQKVVASDVDDFIRRARDEERWRRSIKGQM